MNFYHKKQTRDMVLSSVAAGHSRKRLLGGNLTSSPAPLYLAPLLGTFCGLLWGYSGEQELPFV